MSDDGFAALVARVGAFHVTDRSLKSAQTKIEEALRRGDIDARARDEYLDAVRRYFTPFEREARGHLRDVDRRLEHANQVVFNLTAERGVAVKRIEATQGVLADLDALADGTR
jgi:hypothetical protein